MYLLDTNVISEIRKVGSPKVDCNVIAWLESVSPSQLYISSITVLELELGVLLKERKDPRQGLVLRSWLDSRVLPTFEGRIVPVDTAVAQRSAALHVPSPVSDRDALIAATALIHSMIVVTRNTKDFESTKVKLLNPWQIQS